MKRDELLKEIEKEFGPGCMLICKERARQKVVKGYDINRDKELYQNEELANASMTYAMDDEEWDRDSFWPWSLEYWNPTPDNRQREFEKSGALMAAQLDVTVNIDKKS